MPLAAAMAFENLGALILGNHALHLQEEVIFWTLAQGPVQKDHLHPGAPEFVDQQDLIRIFAGQAIRRVHREAVYTARRDHITQPFESRSDQSGSTVPFIKELHGFGHHEAIRRNPLAQGGSLTRDRVRVGLLLRRYPGVNGSLRCIHASCLLPPCCLCWMHSACRVGRARGVVRRVSGTTCSYACITQAGRTRLGSNVMCTSRVLLRLCARRATLVSLLPWRWALQRQPRLERRPQKPIPITGAQLGSWNAR